MASQKGDKILVPGHYQLVAGYILLSITLILGILTSMTALYLQTSFGLNIQEPDILKTLATKDGNTELLLNRNVFTNKFIAQEEFLFDNIQAKQIKILNSNKAKIQLNQDGVELEAAHYYLGYNQPLNFHLSKRADVLEVTNGIKNIRRIRGPRTTRMELTSDEKLELSGNLGLNIHASKELGMDSSQQILIQSREESIDISGSKGILLPSIPHEDEPMEKVNYLEDNNLKNSQTTGRNNLCIDRTNGLVLTSMDSCY